MFQEVYTREPRSEHPFDQPKCLPPGDRVVRTFPFDDIKTFNTVAQEVMRSREIAINDLYGFVLPHAKEWQTGDQVHFSALGNQQLGQRVSEKILEALDLKKP